MPSPNTCAFTAIYNLTKIDKEAATSACMILGSDELKREIKQQEPAGDEVFDVVGKQAVVNFDLFIYLSDIKRVKIKTLGCLVPEAKTYEVRFEPFGMTYEEILDLPYNPLYQPGHWEAVTEPTSRVREVPMPAKW